MNVMWRIYEQIKYTKEIFFWYQQCFRNLYVYLECSMLPRGYICYLHQCSMQEIIRQFMMGKYHNWPNYFMHLALITYLLNSIFTMLTISCSFMAISVTNSLPSPVNFVLFAILSVLSYCRCYCRHQEG